MRAPVCVAHILDPVGFVRSLGYDEALGRYLERLARVEIRVAGNADGADIEDADFLKSHDIAVAEHAKCPQETAAFIRALISRGDDDVGATIGR